MTDFLLELLSEEIPARMQAKAREELARLFADEMGQAGLPAEAIETFSTPRRLALFARRLPAATAAVSTETKGPRTSAPPQALEGFLRKTGLSREELIERDGVFFAVVEQPGRPTIVVLAEAIPAIVRAFPWPKSMRWGEASRDMAGPRWVRPLRGIVALFGEEVVSCEVAGIASGATTPGHRFHHPGPVTIGSAEDYAVKLRACHVIVDQDEREAIIRDGAARAAEAAGLRLVPDEGLVVENAGLTEWPVPLLGKFDPAFLEVPREVIQLTMRTNQKYFACTEGDSLAPAFVCTANIEAKDGGAAIVAGNAKVLAARLADARFFWEQDRKVPLEEQAKKLSQIVFHEKLGTVADKVERVAKLARWLVEEGIVPPLPARREGPGVGSSPSGAEAGGEQPTPNPSLPGRGAERADLASLAERAARLCKADLVTGMVGEFPELQGVMGGYYARAEGLPDEVADAIRDHYKPVGQGEAVPTAPVTVAVSLADKLDTIFSFWFLGEKPTGSKDPFAIRRGVISVEALIDASKIRITIKELLAATLSSWINDTAAPNQPYASLDDGSPVSMLRAIDDDLIVRLRMTDESITLPFGTGSSDLRKSSVREWVRFVVPLQETLASIRAFFADRLKVQQREAGVRHDLIDAVFALGGEDDLVRLLARVKALQAFVGTEDGANLLGGYRRAANILAKEGWAADTGRHAELGSASIVPRSPSQKEEEWTLKQVQGDDATSYPSLTDTNQSSYAPLPEEESLRLAVTAAEPRAESAIAAEDFGEAMRVLAGLREPVDAFFERVTVNDPDPAKRATRLALLARVRDAIDRVADFSKIVG